MKRKMIYSILLVVALLLCWQGYEFWVAVPGDYPDFYYGFQYWQYSFDSQVPGVEGPTDLNLLFIPVPKAEGEESS